MIRHRLRFENGNIHIDLRDTTQRKPLDSIDLGNVLKEMNDTQLAHLAAFGLWHRVYDSSVMIEDKKLRFDKMKQMISRWQKSGEILNVRGEPLE